jgi:hypothetical protein
VCTTDGLGPDLGEPDVPDVPRLDHLSDRAHRLLDRHLGEDPSRPVDVHVLGTEPTKRVGEEVLDRGGPQVVPDDAAVGGTHEPELDADYGLFAVAAAKRLADEQLVVARGVVVAGVEQRDSPVERRLDRGDRLCLVGGAVEVRHAHAAKA